MFGFIFQNTEIYILGLAFNLIKGDFLFQFAENGGYPPTQNGDIRSLFWLFSLMALQN